MFTFIAHCRRVTHCFLGRQCHFNLHVYNNKCIGDETKAATRQSLNCIKTKKVCRKTILNMADRFLTPCNVACGSEIMTVDSPSGRPTERGGVAGASAPGPGGPKGPGGPPKKLSLCEKRWKRGRMGRLKTVHQTQHASSLELNFFWRALRAPFWAPLGPPGPGSSCPVGSKTCHVLLDDCQKSQTGSKSVDSKETRLF